jgi:FkbM family methyltransferase
MKNWLIYDNINKFYYESTFEDVKQKHNWVSYEIFYKENYECEYSNTGNIYEMYDCVVEPNDIVVDLGSNVGFFTNKIAPIASRVISVEGSPELFSCLVKNTFQYQNIEYVNANIVSDENIKEKNIWSYRPSTINLTLKQLFDLYNLEKIDFLKVDIESAEYDIFHENIDPLLLSKIRKISMEIHVDQTNYDDINVNRLIKNIKNKNVKNFTWYLPSHVQKTLYFTS